MKNVRLTLLVGLFLTGAGVVGAQEDCRVPPCPRGIGPVSLDATNAGRLLADLTEVGSNLDSMLEITTDPTLYSDGIPKIVQALTELILDAEESTDQCMALARAALAGEEVHVADTFALVAQLDAALASQLFPIAGLAITVPTFEELLDKLRRRVRRLTARAECMTMAQLTDDPEYAAGVESSCHDEKDNDCDGFIDCGYFSPRYDLFFSADTDCRCGR